MRLLVPLAALAALLLAVPAAHAQSQPTCPWMQAGKTPEQRADDLIGAMTLDQKLHQVTFSTPQWFAYYGTAGHIDGTPELCIPTLVLSDAGSGVAGLQQGTTTFPSGVGQAAMWDPALERAFGEAMGQEAWNKGINVMLGPGLNIARIATNGRNFEYMGEDPFLTGKTACENPELLDGYLRRDWGFTGFVTSDWGATHSTLGSAQAGMDMEMHAAPPQYYGDPLKQAVTEG